MQTNTTMLAVTESVKESIKTIQDKLSACALDGTPFLLVIEKNGRELVYGDWNGRKGFKDAEVVPEHLCGTFQFSPESARCNAAKLNASGEKAHYIHWRAFLQGRLESLQHLLTTLRAS